MISDESKERLLKMRSILKEIKISSVLLLLGASALLAFSFISAIGFQYFMEYLNNLIHCLRRLQRNRCWRR